MRKSLFSFFNFGDRPAKPTFGQKRAEQLSQRLEKAITDRRILARAQAAASDPLKTTYSHKAGQAERKIDRLTAEIFDAKK